MKFVLITGLIVLAALSRLIPHPPNFAPIGAVALFAAATFRNKLAAILVPLLALLGSDCLLQVAYRYQLLPGWLAQSYGFHTGMWFVYGSFLLIWLMGLGLRKHRSFVPIAGATLLGSVFFFLITNFGVWVMGSEATYAKTWQGLMACYTAGIPFFRNALAGDVFYATALFGGWALLEGRLKATQRASLAEPQLEASRQGVVAESPGV